MKYPPAEIVEFVLQKAAYSGNHGISLKDIWLELSAFLEETLDEFLKNIIWQWIFFDEANSRPEDESRLNVFKSDLDIPLPLVANYEEFISVNLNELNLVIKPSPDTQWKYLTGLENLKRLKSQLGEFPFNLLCETARSGKLGILAPDLAKNTGQDPRSLTPRLKKLEDLGLILKKDYYNKKSRQHTSLCIHKNFARDDFSSTVADLNEDLEGSRNVQKTKEYIVDAVKKAPNQLRGFRDLKVELKLDKNLSSSKFFRSIAEYLDKRGYVERLMVREAEDRPLVYCIKYLKDIPKDNNDMDDLSHVFGLESENGISEDEDGDDVNVDGSKEPMISKSFSLQNQIYEFVLTFGTTGATSMDIVRNISGISDCRPYTKALDLFTSFVIDHENLKKLRKYDDDYENYSIVRGYDFEGKYKFYRYFTKENYLKLSSNSKTEKKLKVSKTTKLSTNIQALNKKYFSPIGSISNTSLSKGVPTIRGKRKIDKIAELDKNAEPRVERRGRPKKSQKAIDVDLESPKPKRSRVRSNKETLQATEIVNSISNVNNSIVSLKNDAIMISDDSLDQVPPTSNSSENNIPEQLEQLEQQSKAAIAVEGVKRPVLESKKPLVMAPSGSLKAIKRRSALMEIIKDQGGVTYTTANLCRLVDEKLGNTTITDKKTLARDVSYLITSHELEAEDISFSRSGQLVTRKLLILIDPTLRPTDEIISRVKEQCVSDNGNKQTSLTERRVIEDQVTLFNPSLAKKSNRLSSLKSRSKRKVKQEDEDKDISGLPEGPSQIKKRTSRKDRRSNTLGDDKGDGSRSTILPRKRKPRVKSSNKKTKAISTTEPGSRIRVRGDIKFDQEQATKLFRAVVIWKSFKKGPIDFESISHLFDDMTFNEVKRKWITVRKVVGGLTAVMRGSRVFERILTRAIEEGKVTSSDLLDFDFEYLSSIWEEADNSILEGIDSNPFYSTIEGNTEEYEILDYKENYSETFEQLEDNSMRQKEIILSGTTFYCDNGQSIVPKKNDNLRSILKATFATLKESFSSQPVKNILSQYGQEVTQEAINSLQKDKEITYHTFQDSVARFLLTDKFHNSLVQKVFTSKFFQQASQFQSNFTSVVEANKGLILSQGISSGEVASLINLLIVNDNSIITRVDKPYKFTGYESRLIDKSNLSCDIVFSGKVAKDSTLQIAKVPVPTGKACSHIWLDLNGSIDAKLWSKIIISTLYHIVFKPGIPQFHLYRKLSTVLSVDDFKEVINWLDKSKVIRKGSNDGLIAINEWYSILGH